MPRRVKKRTLRRVHLAHSSQRSVERLNDCDSHSRGNRQERFQLRIPSRNIHLSIIVEEIPIAKPSGSQAGSWRRRDFPRAVEAGYHEAH